MILRYSEKIRKRVADRSNLLRQIPRGQALLVFKLAAFSLLVPLIMKLPLSRSERYLVPVSPPAPTPHAVSNENIANFLHCTSLALKLGRPFTQNRCLTRCITLFYFLSRQGLDLSVVFGAGTLDGKFAAHCWLEKDGTVVGEQENPYLVYLATYSIPSSTRKRALDTG